MLEPIPSTDASQPFGSARAADAADVARVVRLARETGLPLAVRSGGHSGAGHSTTDSGIVLDLRDMKALEVDVQGASAWAEAGLTAAEYSAGVGSHGSATGFGDTGSVGIGATAPVWTFSANSLRAASGTMIWFLSSWVGAREGVRSQ